MQAEEVAATETLSFPLPPTRAMPQIRPLKGGLLIL